MTGEHSLQLCPPCFPYMAVEQREHLGDLDGEDHGRAGGGKRGRHSQGGVFWRLHA